MSLKETDATAEEEDSGAAEDAVAPAEDYLSKLPDAILHHVMSFLKAWEAVRTCVLSRRWRHLWASAPCVDIRWTLGRKLLADMRRFVHRLLLARDDNAPVITLRLRTGYEDGYKDYYDNGDVKKWIREAIERKARVIQFEDHIKRFVVLDLDHQTFASNHLKILKLSKTQLDDNVFRGFSSQCPSLEELELKDCLVRAHEISSVTLKSLIMVKCNFTLNLSVDTPNLVFLKCITPVKWVPVLKNSGSLITGSIMLDDSLLSADPKSYDRVDGCFSDDYHSGYSDYYFEDCSSDISDDYDYGSDIDSDADTYEYSEIANGYEFEQFTDHDDGGDSSMGGKYPVCSSNYGFNDHRKLGGQNVLQSLSTARSLELLGHSGEVVLSRESRSCPTFSNLKTLSLGEWCISMVADFDILILFLQNSPNLEKLFLQLEMELERGIKPKGGSFACKCLNMVKIKCPKDDLRVHMLAQLFNSNGLPLEKIYVRRTGRFRLRNSKLNRAIARGGCRYWMANGIPFEKIYVHRSGSSHLRNEKVMRDLAKQELDFWGSDELWGPDSAYCGELIFSATAVAFSCSGDRRGENSPAIGITSRRRSARHLFDGMPPKKPTAADDLLSALPDALLHHVMSFLRAWEVARTCVLSRRWRHLWASAPCVDLRVWRGGGHLPPPEKLARFTNHLLFEREVSAPVDTIRMLSSPDGEGEDYTTSDVQMWISAAINRRARVIDLTDHPMEEPFFNLDFVPIISSHLKHLKLTGSLLGERVLRQISCQCPSLEVLELKKCFLDGHEISSTSLRRLNIVECSIGSDLTIAAPNLVHLRCIVPYYRAPLFKDIGSLTQAMATLVLDDSFLYDGYRHRCDDIDDDEEIYGSGDDDGEVYANDSDYDSDDVSNASTCEYSEIANDFDVEIQHEEHGEGHNHIKHANRHFHGHTKNIGVYWTYCPQQGYKNKSNDFWPGQNKSNDRKVLGGHNVLHSLSNARSLKLLADAGEVILNRELKTCPTFSNLKILSLGEWCMGADFDPLVSFLQHSPNLEKLFLVLKLEYCNRQATKEGNKSNQGSSFACSHLKMVKIKCSIADARIHLLAQLFRANGLPIGSIYREVAAPVDTTLRVLSSPVCDTKVENYYTRDVDAWIRAAIKRRAQVIQVSEHPMDEAFSNFDNVPIISCHLKHLKLSGYLFRQRTLIQLSSQCSSLEVLELKGCYLEGYQISSASLKSLIMVECRIMEGFSIDAPNLVSFRCVTPYHRVPLFQNVGSLTLDAATIVLDDSFLYAGYEYQFKDINRDAIEGSGSTNGEGSLNDSDNDSDAVSDASTCEYSEIADDYDDEKQLVEHGKGRNQSKHGNYQGYGRKNKFNGGKVLGGHNVLHRLSNARSLELLADAGEVILNRELKTCPTFSNLKTLSLGEWCMGPEFDPLVSFLQHAPNLERLYIELKLGYGNKQATKDSIKPEGSSFSCAHLKMVKIRCCMDDARAFIPNPGNVKGSNYDHVGSNLLDEMSRRNTTARWVPRDRPETSARPGRGAPGRGGAHVFGRMPPRTTTVRTRWVPRHGQEGMKGHGVVAPADRLSDLPDALLHHVMSFLKAWEVVRTCVLSRRWRHLWASAPCVDLRVRHSGPDSEPPEELRDFVNRLFRRREASAPVDTLRLQLNDEDELFDNNDANAWIRTAMKRDARFIHLIGHRSEIGVLKHKALVSNHLKILKLSYVLLNDKILKQLSSGCKSLEELDLKDCVITGHEISSASLKTLKMDKCKFNVEVSVTAPNLKLGSLVTCSVTLDDVYLGDDYQRISDEDDIDDTTDDDDFGYQRNDKAGYRFDFTRFGLGGKKGDYGYGSDIESDDNTYEYSEIANECGDHQFGHNGVGNSSKDDYNGYGNAETFGGQNVLHCLSNVRSLELLAGAGEVVLSSELKSCPMFSNLKTLSLGEWCIGAEFDALIFLLQHSPNLEKLFIEPQLNFNTRKALESGIKPTTRSFTCKDLQMVKIRCSKDDVRVHTLAHFFRANGIPFEKIYVHRSGSSQLRSEKAMRDLAKQELDFWGQMSYGVQIPRGGARGAGQLFDEMPPKKTKLSSQRDGGRGGDAAVAGAEDRLSALPDAPLHHIMSFLRAWEVARTCVLSRHWCHLWASAPCVDLRVWRGGGHLPHPKNLAKFAYRFLFEREVSAAVDTLRVMSCPGSDYESVAVDYSISDVQTWIRAAIKRRARVIHLTGHPNDEDFTDLDHISVISCHLKHLKLSGCSLGDRILMQLSFQFPSLEILELKKCVLDGREISSASLKSLTMVECKIIADLTIAAPNLVCLRCIKPYNRAPSFENLGSLTLATGTIVLDDSLLCVDHDYEYEYNDEDAINGSNSDDDEGCTNDSNNDSDAVSDTSTCEYSEIANDYDDQKQHEEHGEGHDEVIGGHNVLHILSNAKNLELLGDGEEVILNRELKTCPTFSILKILSLGEWCMGGDFDPLVSFLQNSPNLEGLFLELKLAMRGVTKPVGRSFTCKHLKMVKIKCSMDDSRVHLLAQLFMANGLPIENIYVHRTHSGCEYHFSWKLSSAFPSCPNHGKRVLAKRTRRPWVLKSIHGFSSALIMMAVHHMMLLLITLELCIDGYLNEY
uniref:F-box domain-containing protein n=1 Tax=Leersia perrieri TaxID=77586 RepID=A0A0D9X599_9ORYZ